MTIRTGQSITRQQENGRYGNKDRFYIPEARTRFECPICHWKYSTTKNTLPADCWNCQFDVQDDEWIAGWTKEAIISRSDSRSLATLQNKGA